MANDDVIERAERCLAGWVGDPPIVRDLIAELRASRARVAELEQDARRLDWLFGKGPFDGTSKWNGDVLFGSYFNRDQVDAAMAGEADS